MANPTERTLKVGIQGVQACFHDVAARDFFAGRPLELLECQSFRALCETLQSGQTDLAVMAIENSIAGSILPNYLLLEKFNLRIIGEVYLRIEMNLMALPGQRIGDLQFVQSHPMALFQCEDFLAEHAFIKVLEHADTAESAKDIRDKQMRGTGAIASGLAAEVYGLEILAKSIETNKQNFTRFLVVARSGADGAVAVPVSGGGAGAGAPNKASMRFELSHTTGRLLGVLQIFAAHKINMTKLQSVPILGRPYEYAFHVDIEWDDRNDYDLTMNELRSAVHNLIHFGEYQKAERPGV